MEHKKLYRSRKHRMIAGVAGGLAEYFNIDPVIVRLLFVVLTLGQGAGVLAYIIGWVIIPEEPESTSHENKSVNHDVAAQDVSEPTDEKKIVKADNTDSGRITAGTILVVIGALFLLQNVWGNIVWRNFWPIVLIGLGIALVIRSSEGVKGHK